MIPTETWFPVVTLLVGTALGGVLEALRDGRAIKREAIAAKRTLELEHLRKREAFQRETLLQVQDECAKLARFIGMMHNHDFTTARTGAGEWGKTQLPGGVSDGAFASSQLLSKLRVRLDDGQIRQWVQDLLEIYGTVGASKSENTANAGLMQMVNLTAQINERIGIRLRS